MENMPTQNQNIEESYEERLKKKLEKAAKKEEKSFVGFFIKNFRFTYLILFTIVILGFYSMFTLPREAEPEVRVPYAVVTTIYPGANPTDIEDLITNKIEDEIKNLENIKQFNSSSGQGFSSVFVEYDAEADLQESFRKLREAADNAENKLPSEAETPVVTEINFNDFPIVTYSLVGDYDDVELKKFADQIQDELEDVKDVSEVEIIGGLTREFQVIINQAKIVSFGISLPQIVSAIQSSNFSLPAGEIEIDEFKYGVRIKGKIEQADELNDIVVATYDSSPVFLRDVAVIKDDYKEKETESYIGFYNEESKNTISLQVYKKTGGNILDIVKNSQELLTKLGENGTLPQDLKVIKTNDNSVFIKDDLKTLGTSAIQTIILITLILLFILSLKGAIITAMSVPIAFLMAFMFLKAQGMTLNSMVLFSLVLSLGLMVDNAIVIIEGINEYVSQHGKSVYKAALLSVWNFKWPITAGTLTTVGAFLPMLLVSGILGEYMGILPKTISVTLLSSLFVATVVISTLATRFIKPSAVGHHSHRDKKRHLFLDNKINKIKQGYVNLLKSLLPDKKKRRLVIIFAWILFFVALAVPLSGVMKIEMFPDIDMDYFVVNIELPVGSNLDQNRMIVRQAEGIVAQVEEVDNYVTNIGTAASLGFGGGGGSGTHLSSITINLIDKKERERKSYEIANSIRSDISRIQGADVRVEELEAGPPSGSPIEVRIFGTNTKGLDLLSQKVVNYFKGVDGVINIDDSIEDSTGEFTFTIDKQQANYYGLSVASISSTLRNAIYGTEASQVSIDGDDVDITVKYHKNDITSVGDLENILLITNTGDSIPVKQIADLKIEPSLTSISHRDGEKIATVSADIEAGINLQEVLAGFEEYKDSINIPDGFSVQIGGEVEDIQQSFTELFLSMIISVLIIAVILVLQFNSFKQPFIIIFSVPLSFIGVIIGLNLFGQPFSFTAFIGIVSLSGIVVNDAIVLIDRINKNIANGLEFYSSIIEAGLARMQPIFLTSITTIAGIFPLIYASELWRGLSLTVIFGLIFSTMLVLVVIPIIYASLCRPGKCKK